jgi:DNA-binding beta-propeller fold protein YncE
VGRKIAAAFGAALVLIAAQAASATHPQISVGGFPTGIALNPETDTIYVGNGNTGTLSLIDGQRCNASTSRGCRQRLTAVTAGIDPIGIAVDGRTGTLYVANASGTVAVVDGRRCNASDTSRCRARPATVRVGPNPQFLAVDEKTHTVYVANSGTDTVSLIDADACNARHTSGCKVVATVKAGPLPFTLAVNDVTGTLYVADLGAGTVSVLDASSCNATNTSGCGRKPATVRVGDFPGGIALDSRTNTVYVTGQVTNDVWVIDGKRCNARVRSGCGRTPVRVPAGLGARGIALNEKTDTVYVANTAAGTVSVIDGSTCNASVQTGCRRSSPQALVGVSPRRVVVDEVTNTVYVTNAGSNSVTVLNGRTCNGRVHRGCEAVSSGTGPGPSAGSTTTKPSTVPTA